MADKKVVAVAQSVPVKMYELANRIPLIKDAKLKAKAERIVGNSPVGLVVYLSSEFMARIDDSIASVGSTNPPAEEPPQVEIDPPANDAE